MTELNILCKVHLTKKVQQVEVKVRDNQVDKALRVLKRKLQAEGIFREMRQREFYESPSEKRRREKNEATRRYQRERRRQAEADRRR